MTPSTASRRPRTDAVRNAARIVEAADRVFAESGVDVPLEEIAAKAGVGIATLYRHFANKDELVRAVLRQAFADEIEPVLREALGKEEEALTGLVTVLSAAISMASRRRNALAAAKRPGRIPLDMAPPFFQRLAVLLARAQEQGSIRPDLQPEDLPRLVMMLSSTFWSDDSPDGWRRYLTLLLDALRPLSPTPLPPAAPLRRNTFEQRR